MTVEELEQLASQGDSKAMFTLADYYFHGNEGKIVDVDKAQDWALKGITAGNEGCIYQYASFGYIEICAIKKISPDASVEYIDKMKTVLEYAELANEKGWDFINVNEYKAQLGELFYYKYTQTKNMFDLEQAKGLVSVGYPYKLQWYNELYIYILQKYIDLNLLDEEMKQFYHQLVSMLVESHFQELENANIVCFYLGLDFLYGIGCWIDYPKAYSYFLKAQDLGFDCKEIFQHFYRDSYGKWHVE